MYKRAIVIDLWVSEVYVCVSQSTPCQVGDMMANDERAMEIKQWMLPELFRLVRHGGVKLAFDRKRKTTHV